MSIELAEQTAAIELAEAPPGNGPAVPAAVSAAVLAAVAAGGLAAAVLALRKAGALPKVAAAVLSAFRGSRPATGQLRAKNGQGWAARENVKRRAHYLIAAAQRVSMAVQSGTPLKDAMAKERRHYDAHAAACARRTSVGQHLDQQAPGTLRRWVTVMDERTTPECRAMHGQTFDLRQPPTIGLPSAVHPLCRCTAVPVPTTNLSRMETTVDTRVRYHDGTIVDLARPTPTPATSLGAIELTDHEPEDQWNRPIQAPRFNRSGHRIEDPADPEQHRVEAAPPSAETEAEVAWLRENYPMAFGPGPSDLGDLARDITARRYVGGAFDEIGQATHQRAVGMTSATEDPDRMWCRPGETDLERRVRVANDDWADPQRTYVAEAMRSYAERSGLI